MTSLLTIVAVICVSTIIGAFGALLLKHGSTRFRINPLALLRNWQFIAGGILYVISWAIYMMVLPLTPLSIAYPLTSMSYIWVTLLSHYRLGEEIDAWRWAGIGFIICGIVLISV